MFTAIGAIIGVIIDIIIVLFLGVTIISLPFVVIGWIVGKMAKAFQNAKK